MENFFTIKLIKIKGFAASYFPFRACFQYFYKAVFLLALLALPLFAQTRNKFEDRPISDVTVTFEGTDRDVSAKDQFQSIARNALGERYSAVKVRDALEALYRTDRVAFISVEAADAAQNGVNLRFIIRRKTEVQKVVINIGNTDGDEITEDDLLYKLNLITPGNTVTEQVLQKNADRILEYLRERGYFKSEVGFIQTPIDSDTEVAVTFNVTPNTQATVEEFKIDIAGFSPVKTREKLDLKPGEAFTRELLTKDVERIRDALRKEKFLAPDLNDPRVIFDSESNSVNIELTGKVGATVEITVDSKEHKVGERTQTRLLPIKREGTLDYSAIVEGRRRLETFYQEQGYFFAEVTPICSVEPEFVENEASYTVNETEVLCSALSGAELTDRKVIVTYEADLNRRLTLVDIRIEGTDKLPTEEITPILKSQEASVLGIIPVSRLRARLYEPRIARRRPHDDPFADARTRLPQRAG